MSRLIIRKVAVLGAGVGAQIAAHCANAGVPVVLFDLPARKGDPNGVAKEGARRHEEARPGAFRRQGRPSSSTPPTTAATSSCRGCDLVIEAIAEKMEWKLDPTPGGRAASPPGRDLCVQHLGPVDRRPRRRLPESLRDQFCGIHFFNPPRYMPLVELIPPRHRPGLLDDLEAWLTTRSARASIRAKDTPNFVANRVGVFSILAVMHHTARLGLASTRSTPSPARHRPPQERHLTAPPTWSASTPWRTCRHHAGHPAGTTPGWATCQERPVAAGA